MKVTKTRTARTLGRTAIAGVWAIVVAGSAHAANEYETQQQVFQGAHCQAMYGSQSSRIIHNIDWLSNNSNQPTYVSCSLTRDSVQKSSTAPRARVRVYRPNGAGALDCLFYARTLGGTTYSTSGSAVQGWSYVDMTLPDTAPGASYAVRCRLPGAARIQKIVLDE